MAVQRKISKKKVISVSITTLLVVIFLTTLIAAAKKQENAPIQGIRVKMENSNKEEQFLIAKDVEDLFLRDQHINLKEETVGSIDLDQIESIALTNPWVKNAEVFVDNHNILNIKIQQRSPKARIFNQKGNSYYIDNEGFEMPVITGKYAYAVPVFTGFPNITNDSVEQEIKEEIIRLSNFIIADTFWANQITQIEINKTNEYSFYGNFGNQKIILGDTSNLSEKFVNLYSFYKQVSNKIGWDKYEVIDLRFKNQVVSSPSLGWSPPEEEKVDSTNKIDVIEETALVPDSTSNQEKN